MRTQNKTGKDRNSFLTLSNGQKTMTQNANKTSQKNLQTAPLGISPIEEQTIKTESDSILKDNFFNNLKLICKKHGAEIGGVCADYSCQGRNQLKCIKCLGDSKICIRQNRHLYISLDEFYDKFLNVDYYNLKHDFNTCKMMGMAENFCKNEELILNNFEKKKKIFIQNFELAYKDILENLEILKKNFIENFTFFMNDKYQELKTNLMKLDNIMNYDIFEGFDTSLLKFKIQRLNYDGLDELFINIKKTIVNLKSNKHVPLCNQIEELQIDRKNYENLTEFIKSSLRESIEDGFQNCISKIQKEIESKLFYKEKKDVILLSDLNKVYEEPIDYSINSLFVDKQFVVFQNHNYEEGDKEKYFLAYPTQNHQIKIEYFDKIIEQSFNNLNNINANNKNLNNNDLININNNLNTENFTSNFNTKLNTLDKNFSLNLNTNTISEINTDANNKCINNRYINSNREHKTNIKSNSKNKNCFCVNNDNVGNNLNTFSSESAKKLARSLNEMNMKIRDNLLYFKLKGHIAKITILKYFYHPKKQIDFLVSTGHDKSIRIWNVFNIKNYINKQQDDAQGKKKEEQKLKDKAKLWDEYAKDAELNDAESSFRSRNIVKLIGHKNPVTQLEIYYYKKIDRIFIISLALGEKIKIWDFDNGDLVQEFYDRTSDYKGLFEDMFIITEKEVLSSNEDDILTNDLIGYNDNINNNNNNTNNIAIAKNKNNEITLRNDNTDSSNTNNINNTNSIKNLNNTTGDKNDKTLKSNDNKNNNNTNSSNTPNSDANNTAKGNKKNISSAQINPKCSISKAIHSSRKKVKPISQNYRAFIITMNNSKRIIKLWEFPSGNVLHVLPYIHQEPVMKLLNYQKYNKILLIDRAGQSAIMEFLLGENNLIFPSIKSLQLDIKNLERCDAMFWDESTIIFPTINGRILEYSLENRKVIDKCVICDKAITCCQRMEIDDMWNNNENINNSKEGDLNNLISETKNIKKKVLFICHSTGQTLYILG